MSRRVPRRIVFDAEGGFYYSDDHNQSFRRIER